MTTTPRSGPRLPDLVIIGVSKAGTTSLFHYLRQHPEVCPSDVKEVRYLTPLRYGEKLEPISSYTAHFSGCGQETYAMEATPGYFYGGRDLAHGLHELSPSVRAVVSLREPGARCWSWFRFVKSRTRIPKDMSFTTYLDRCEELNRQGRDGDYENQPFWGLGGGCYANWLDAWSNELDDRFRVLFFDDIVEDPRGTVKALCEWLGIDSGVVDQFQLTVDNKTEPYRNRAVQTAAVRLNRRSERFFLRHERTKRVLRRIYYAANKAPSEEQMSEDERLRLRAFYRDHNARLADKLDTLGLSLPSSWAHS
jgi:Sulfotransferase domain